MARLIRTEKEVEGRYEEVWLVVEEDALDQWPAGPGEVVGRPADAADRPPARARGQAVYTADLQLNGMLHAAVLRSPHPHARVRRIDLSPALALPGVHAAIGPDDMPSLVSEAGYEGAAVAAVCADTRAQAIAAVAAIEVEWEVREPLLDPDEAVARESLIGEPARHARGDFERALAEADVVLTGEYRTQVVVHSSLETHQSVGAVGRRHARDPHLDAVHLGRARRGRGRARAAARQGARDLPLHGRRLRLEERRRRLHLHRDRARAAHRPARPLRAVAPRGRASSPATATRRSSG